MSHSYDMMFTVDTKNLTKEELETVISCIESEWNIEEDSKYNHEEHHLFILSGEGSLGLGESSDEFAERIVYLLWETLHKCILLNIKATYLDDLPYDIHSFDEDDYQAWLQAKSQL